MLIHLYIIFFHATVAELSSYNRDRMAYKAKNIHYVVGPLLDLVGPKEKDLCVMSRWLLNFFPRLVNLFPESYVFLLPDLLLRFGEARFLVASWERVYERYFFFWELACLKMSFATLTIYY